MRRGKDSSDEGRRAEARRAGPSLRSTRPRALVSQAPEEHLYRAMRARSPGSRALWARRGLATKAPLDRTTHSMLLRQLYLAHYEARRFKDALAVSEQNLELGILRDVAHQDVARVMQALGDVDGAAGHLRLAARVSPAKRKAFHWWTLGSFLYLAGRHDAAASALLRASRWGTTDKPLYRGQLAVVHCAQGRRVGGLDVLIERLAEVPAGQGYGRFVLGQLAYHAEHWEDARRHLEAFVRRSTEGRTAMAIALSGEVALARRTLASMKAAG